MQICQIFFKKMTNIKLVLLSSFEDGELSCRWLGLMSIEVIMRKKMLFFKAFQALRRTDEG